MTNTFYIGAHSSISKGLTKSLKAIESIGGNAIQIFLKSPQSKYSKPLDNNDAILADTYRSKNNLFLVGHCSYLLNFAKPFSKNPWAVNSLLDDLIRINKLGGVGIVLHIGKYLKYSKEEAFKNIKDNLLRVIKQMPDNVYVIWENTAGQGTEIGYKIEELSELYNYLNKHPKIRFCLDTCHAHASGYNLSTKEGVQDWKTHFDKLIGWDKVVCIHFNDSKRECGSRVDRHEDLGFGTIGKNGLKEIALLAKKTNKPLILETPSKYLTYEEQIKQVKSWIK